MPFDPLVFKREISEIFSTNRNGRRPQCRAWGRAALHSSTSSREEGNERDCRRGTKWLAVALAKFQNQPQRSALETLTESDTVWLVRKIGLDVFGFDDSEMTDAYAVSRTYCDLAIRGGEQPIFFIEVKRTGLPTLESFLSETDQGGGHSWREVGYPHQRCGMADSPHAAR